MSTEIQILPASLEVVIEKRSTEIELTKAQSHAVAFAPLMQQYHVIAAKLSELDKVNPSDADVKLARESRLKMVKIRTGSATIKDERKALLVAESNLIQSLYNVVKDTCLVTEGEFEQVEKHHARMEAERIEKIRSERLALLEPYESDTQFIDLGAMTDDQFNAFLSREKMAFDAKIEQERKTEEARIEAEKKAEAERIAKEKAEAEERKRIEAENAKLKAEQEKLRKEQEKREAAAKQEADRLAKIAAEEKAKNDKILADAKAKADADAAEIARVNAELKAKQDAIDLAHEQEMQRIADEEADRVAKLKAEALAPDKEKINKLYLTIKNFEFPELTSPDAIQLIEEVKQGFQIVLNGIKEGAKKLK